MPEEMDFDDSDSVSQDPGNDNNQDFNAEDELFAKIRGPLLELTKILASSSPQSCYSGDLGVIEVALSKLQSGINFYHSYIHELTGSQFRHMRSSFRALADQALDAVEQAKTSTNQFANAVQSDKLSNLSAVEYAFSDLAEKRCSGLQQDVHALNHQLPSDFLVADICLRGFNDIMLDVVEVLQSLAMKMLQRVRLCKQKLLSEEHIELDSDLATYQPTDTGTPADTYDESRSWADVYPLPEGWGDPATYGVIEGVEFVFDPNYDVENDEGSIEHQAINICYDRYNDETTDEEGNSDDEYGDETGGRRT